MNAGSKISLKTPLTIRRRRTVRKGVFTGKFTKRKIK